MWLKVFGQPFRTEDFDRVSYNPWLENDKHKYSDDNKRVSKDVMNRWANFIHNDSPNKEEVKPVWPVYSNDKNAKHLHLYLSVLQNGTQISKLFHSSHCKTWNHEVPRQIPHKRL